MDKVGVVLTLITILIVVGPLFGVVYLYRSNLSGLVLTPEIKRLTSGNYSQSQFQPPMPVGEPQYDPQTNRFSFAFNFTNPLQNMVSLEDLTAGLKCIDHNVHLGDVSISEPLTIAPGETVTINAGGTWTQEALNHFAAQHSGPEDDDIHVAFEDLNVNLAGIKVHLDDLDVGWIALPPR